MKLRTLHLLVALCLTLCLVPAAFAAENPATSDNQEPALATPAQDQLSPVIDTSLEAALAAGKAWTAAATGGSNDVETRYTICYVRCGEINLTFYGLNLYECHELILYYCG